MSEDVGLVKAPRICEMIREETGYGFNLHGEKGVIGQYISAIDQGLFAFLTGSFFLVCCIRAATLHCPRLENHGIELLTNKSPNFTK